MRNLKLGLFSMLCAVFMFWITTAFDINVWPENYYWTLTLNRVNIMKSYGITWIVLDGTWYEISIASGATPWYWKISVYQICWQGWWNCKQVSQLSTTTPVMNSITDNWLVEKTNGVANKVWKTNARWEPQWLDDATGSISINAYTPTLSRGSPSTIIKINDSTATVTLPSNPHYVWIIVAASTSNWTSNTNTTDPYLNYVENSTVKSRIQIKWSGSTTVSANNGIITITSTWDGGTSLWQTSWANFIKPKNDSYNVTIGNIQIKTWDNGGCSTNQLIPGIIYTDKFFIRSSNYGWGCGIASKPIIMDSSWHVAINASINETYATVIGGTTEINGSVTVEWEILGTSTLNTPSAVHNTSATINWNKFQSNKVWIQKTPGSLWEPLQINGGIQVSNYSTPTMNNTCNVEWAIEYYNGYFYWCAKKWNTSAKRARLSIYFQEGQVVFD